MMVLHPDFRELQEFMVRLPEIFHQEGECIYKGRNELRLFREKGYELVVKSYKRPNIVNRIAYGFLRSSKAERAYLYGLKLQESGFGTPQPIGFITCRKNLLFDKSFSVSLRSTCPYTYRDFNKQSFIRQDEILETIALYTARLHTMGFLHQDYSGGNILFNDNEESIHIEIVDLNRMVFHKKIGFKAGCKNFERLPGTDDMVRTMGVTYARARGFDPELCVRTIKKYIDIEIKVRLKRS